MIKIEKTKTLVGIILALVAVLFCFITSEPTATSGVWHLATFVPCVATLADSITMDCDNPRVQGYEDTALIFNRNDIDWSSVVTDANNPRIIKSFSTLSGKAPFVIYNPKRVPASFDGSNTTLNSENGKYTKAVQFYFEGVGGGASKDVVEPLANGSFVILLQRKDHKGHGSFQLMGWQAGMYANAQVQDETTGYWLITMNTDEPYAEVELFDTDYATTKSAFDDMLARVA